VTSVAAGCGRRKEKQVGDRANIYLVDTKDEAHGIYLYTHWGGYEYPESLRQALIAGQSRWGDESYLNRIIISRVVTDHDSMTGAGVSTQMCDNEYPILVCDTLQSTVAFATPGLEDRRETWKAVTPFAEFVKEPASWPDR
jgi:hypothetical protein